MADIELSLDDTARLADVGRALSVPVRIELLKLLCRQELNVNEIADKLNIAQSSAAAHVNALVKAGLVETQLKPAQRGAMKLCSIAVENIGIHMQTKDTGKRTSMVSMPIGQYTDYKVESTCGLAGVSGPIGAEDSPNSYYNPDRVNAALLWFCNGYVEYRFPNDMLDGLEESMEFSMELCSEDHEFNLERKSDITVWVNGLEAGTWCCPSDFGGRRGRCNPSWWPDKNTQYGKLKRFKITKHGTYLDGRKIGEQNLSDYQLSEKEYISLRIGNKPDAENNGGVNLFGDGFGDYPQNIVMKVTYVR